MPTFTIAANGIANANFAELEKQARSMTVAQLQYASKDCREAIRAFPEGHKAGYYADVCHVYGAEIAKRQK